MTKIRRLWIRTLVPIHARISRVSSWMSDTDERLSLYLRRQQIEAGLLPPEQYNPVLTRLFAHSIVRRMQATPTEATPTEDSTC